MNPDPDNLEDILKSFSEKFSENQKRERGRPAKYSQKDYAPFAKKRKWAKTLRGKQNYILIGRAYQFLRHDQERFAWILGEKRRGKKAKQPGRKPRLRATILSELGRIEDTCVMARRIYSFVLSDDAAASSDKLTII